MTNCKHITASTLVEMLVLMILSGVVFLSVMDGQNLFRRAVLRTEDRIGRSASFYAGYSAFENLVSTADSVKTAGENTLIFFKQDESPRLAIRSDSLLMIRIGERTDTIFHSVIKMTIHSLASDLECADTIFIQLRTPDQFDHLLTFGVTPMPGSRSQQTLCEIEELYRYEE